MHPWEIRLKDLARLLRLTGESYLDPELFRQNANQFLQTSRTVTFIVQKHKSKVPDFESWYEKTIRAPWAKDSLMLWARDARNVIEKEGDLELHSSVQAVVVFSHHPEQDIALSNTEQEHLNADVTRLLELAYAKIPSPALDAALLQVERRWVANSLPDHELVAAMTYVYSRHYDGCLALARHLGTPLDSSVPEPTSLDPMCNDVTKARFFRFCDPTIKQLSSVRVKKDDAFEPPEALRRIKSDFENQPRPEKLADVVAQHARLAKYNFETFGFHVPMLHLFDRNWNIIDFLGAGFADQSEKFLFWRHAAERATYLRAYGLVWVAESWVRDLSEVGDVPLGELPIRGECLHVVGADAEGHRCAIGWAIRREEPDSTPVLEDSPDSKLTAAFFLDPVIDAMRKSWSTD